MHSLDQLKSGELAGSCRLTLSCGLTQFPLEILQLAESLEILDLSGNALSELPDSLVQLKKLRILFCSDNQFTALPDVLGRCPALSMVGFKANRIRTVSAESLPSALRWLILTDNQVEALPEAIGRCSQLQKLMLAGNQLQSLPSSLANCQRLELLRVAANQLTALPSWLLTLPRLAWLAYAGNPFVAALESQCSITDSVEDIPWQALTVEQLLGEGASGLIHRARYEPATGPAHTVAVKLFKGTVTSDGLPQSEQAAAMAVGLHPHVIPVLGQVRDHPAGVSGLVLALVDKTFSNLAQPPSFDSCTRDVYPVETYFSVDAALQIAHGMADVAAHWHQRGIMHGDLYGHNILYDGQGGALIGDFGAASFYAVDDQAMAHALQRIEVRAFGCLLEELLTYCKPLPDELLVFNLLQELQSACVAEVSSSRPLFAAITQRLHVAMRRLKEAREV